MLMRYEQGEPQVWHVVHVPSVAVEDQHHLHRDLETLQRERTRTSNRIKGLQSTQGVRLISVHKLPEQLEALRLWDGSPVPNGLRRRLLRVYTHYTFLGQQMAEVEAERRAIVRASQEAHIEKGRQLMHLKGIGINGAWLFVMECFGWRDLQNRRQVGSLAGLTPTPYQSGESTREQGITQAGNRRMRWMAPELAWGWVRYQPESALTLVQGPL